MKKLIAAAAVSVFTAFSLSGCSASLPFNGNRSVSFDKSYTVNADISCGDLKAKAEVTRKGAEEWEFCFTEPKELMGLSFSLDKAGITAKLGALSVTAESNGVYSQLPKIIAQAVDRLPELAQETMTEEDGVLTAQTEFNGKKVIITAAADTGELISLKCPYYKLAVHFSGQADAGDLSTEEIVIIEE